MKLVFMKNVYYEAKTAGEQKCPVLLGNGYWEETANLTKHKTGQLLVQSGAD